jgi:hypothetical protein
MQEQINNDVNSIHDVFQMPLIYRSTFSVVDMNESKPVTQVKVIQPPRLPPESDEMIWDSPLWEREPFSMLGLARSNYI